MNNPRAAYLGQSVSTASPERLVVMLYDRLVLDLQRSAEAQRNGDFATAGRHLIHAQEIVLELRTSLRLDIWEGAQQLAAIYGFLHSELVRANVQRDPAVTESCLEIVTPLADAWREAALASLAAG